ncbi:pentapeptide repeat-containing protein [Nonomuraea basaltis]|uniref:pentapeptide repeat-containing protein n=1 Tax=Nonomuraea basaltis TaxID=2495887 RepID=UPI00110C4448|nr:pentapeptide repeat-containing protein [Nonomuraea basaltis]TMR99534.1 pentapeptide repeat-containing protein [Nonomuraea basaltis]
MAYMGDSIRSWIRQYWVPSVILLAVVATFVWLLWKGPWIMDHEHLTGKMTPAVASVVSGFRTAVVALGAGLVAGAGLVYTHRTLEHTRLRDREQTELTRHTLEVTRKTLEHTRDKDREQAELTREGQVTDRFTKAIGQLALTEVEKLGGVYSLERIMRDSAKDHPTVVEVLAAFVRQHAPAHPPDSAGSAKAERRLDEAVQAALTVLGRRPKDREEPFRIDLHRTDLQKADFNTANLAGAHLWETNLREANLDWVNLSEANLFRADLTGANLSGALMENATLDQANLEGAILLEAEGLTVAQVVAAYPTSSTRLPDELRADPQVQERIAEVEAEEARRMEAAWRARAANTAESPHQGEDS